MEWYQLDTGKVYELTGSSPQGLSLQTVEQKMAAYGYNELPGKKKKPAWLLFTDQFRDFMILVLIAAAVISGVLGEITDTIIIMLIVVLNAIMGFIQEYRAEKAMAALKKMATPHTNVLRNGRVNTISSIELVPGDIVLLEAGAQVPADLRLVETHSLRIDEASLTGEFLPANKTADALEESDIPLGDRYNMAYKGTLATYGRGAGIVVATGLNTEIGKIARMLQEEESVTPLQKRMADFGKKLSWFVLGICTILFAVGLLRGEEPMNMLLIAISLAVAAIPETMPALITIALARGAARMVKKNALIRKLPAVETLGSVTFICTDKTGTLTRNKMKVAMVIPAPEQQAPAIDIPLTDLVMALNQDAIKTDSGQWLGDPTEIALVEYVQQKHPGEQLGAMLSRYPRVSELPFDPDRKCMTTIHRYENRYIAISKGAAESITAILENNALSGYIARETSRLASEGMRVLAYGYRILDTIPTPFSYQAVEKEMIFACLVGMIDPVRDEIKQAIRECKSAGIQPVMITGDHIETAAAIARETGILGPGDLLISGKELNKLSADELDAKVEHIKVYARVSPEQKLNIVKSLQRKNHFVSMTGDGVNDAPSLKAANIGIAMGISGTDVSKEASHMILLDDNFATIIKAIKEGRRIYDNIRRFVKYIMTCNSAEIWIIFLAPLLGLPIPLLPIHILWINLVTDGLPGIALSTEKAEKNIMQRPPRKPGESLLGEGMGYHIIWVGLLITFVTLAIQAWAVKTGHPHWQTMVFTVLSLAQLGHVFAVRSDYEFIYRKGLFSNLPLLGAVVITFLLQVAVVYLPFANKIFKTQPLSIPELLLCIGGAAIIFHAVELEKWIKRKI